jgi:hypothetical protein
MADMDPTFKPVDILMPQEVADFLNDGVPGDDKVKDGRLALCDRDYQAEVDNHDLDLDDAVDDGLVDRSSILDYFT